MCEPGSGRDYFGVTSAWDVVEEVQTRYFNERLVTSPRQRMAVTGREVLRWVGHPHIMKKQRTQFESLLLEIAESAEEWITSAQSMGVAKRMGTSRVLPWDSSDDGIEPPRAAQRAEGRTRRSAVTRRM